MQENASSAVIPKEFKPIRDNNLSTPEDNIDDDREKRSEHVNNLINLNKKQLSKEHKQEKVLLDPRETIQVDNPESHDDALYKLIASDFNKNSELDRSFQFNDLHQEAGGLHYNEEDGSDISDKEESKINNRLSHHSRSSKSHSEDMEDLF
jgi:hypothetical protein